MTPTTISEMIVWIISGPGAGFLAFGLMNVPFIKAFFDERPDYKRYAALGISIAIALVAWLAGIWLGFMPTPGTAQEWVTAAFPILMAVLTSQITHAAAVLRPKRLEFQKLRKENQVSRQIG